MKKWLKTKYAMMFRLSNKIVQMNFTDKTEIILNIGDSFQRLTNDTFRAACHRVTYPPTVKVGSDEMIPERYSIAYFAKPNRAASLFPFKKFITPATPCHYDDITAWDYNNLRIAKLFG